MINSSAFGIKNKVTSMRVAIAMIGEKEMIKWLYMLVVNGISTDKLDELITLSMERAKFCEQIAILSNNLNIAFDAYITGMLSTMDAILNLPMERILDELSIEEYEKGNWDRVITLSHKLNINESDIGRIYFDVINWIKNI